MGAHVLAQCVSYHEPLKMSQKWIEVSPDDIIWDNIDDVSCQVGVQFNLLTITGSLRGSVALCTVMAVDIRRHCFGTDTC